MKKFILGMVAVIAMACSFVSCNNVPKATFNDEIDSLSYCYGVLFGDQYSNFQDSNVVVPDEIMNPDNFLAAFFTAFKRDSSNLKINIEDARNFLNSFQQSMQTRMQQKRDQELAENKTKGAEFMAKNAQKDGIIVTESGLQIEMLTEGTGAKPTEADKVLVNYKGSLIDGTTFDANDSIEFNLGGVVPGFREGIMNMKEGGKAIITMPSDLAYGDRGAGQNIPGGSTLQFEVDLLKVVK